MEDVDRKKMAAALAFDPKKDSAPQVLAKGVGLIAENIVKSAREHDVPVYVDEKLVTQLNNIEVGDSIPPEMFEAVAEILVFIARLDSKRAAKFDG